jgi:hypothetical protein
MEKLTDRPQSSWERASRMHINAPTRRARFATEWAACSVTETTDVSAEGIFLMWQGPTLLPNDFVLEAAIIQYRPVDWVLWGVWKRRMWHVRGHSAVGANRWINSLQANRAQYSFNQHEERITYEGWFESDRTKDIVRRARTDVNPTV